MMPLSVHIVSHTHWDREWYNPVGRFRQRLVALIDELLADPPPPGESFLLDGQAIVAEDYLAVRPERRAELSALLREGRLEAGPWYVLPDELIPGGEALVRNLLAGRRTLRALRARSPAVLYCPDSFGHPAALPLLAQGFGFDAVLAWRGYGGPRWPAGDAAWWAAPGGARVLLLHLPPDGYEFGSNLPSSAPEAAERWARLRSVLAPRSKLGVILVHNGADHHARQLDHREALAALVRAAAPDHARAGSLEGFVQESLQRASTVELPEVTGELRDSYGYIWTLQGTFGTRAAQKRTNAQAERLLLRDAEPWAAMARARGGNSRRGLCEAAWRVLLECQPHDTLCGCSVDQVARAANARWEDALVQGAGIRRDSLLALLDHDEAVARTRPADWHPALVIRNRAARVRQGIAHVRVETFIADVGVGPSSAGSHTRIPETLPSIGLSLRHQVLSERVGHSRIESPRHYPDNDLVVVRDVLAVVGQVPGYGVVTHRLDAVDAPHDPRQPLADARLVGRELSNGLVTFTVDTLLDLECHRDVGDLYTPAIREPSPAPDRLGMRVLHKGPLRASVALDWRVPPAGDGDATLVTTTLSVDAGERFARIALSGDHRGTDQRIRLLVRTGITNAAVWADAAFGAVERLPVDMGEAAAARERPVRTAPMHRYVSLFGEKGGATVFSDGLAEYEVLEEGIVAVTLVRAVGELSRNDLPERPGHAGWPSPTPEAQSHGPFAAELALWFHGGRRDADTIAAIERTAEDVLLPLTGETLRSAISLPGEVPGVILEGEGLAFSSLKDSEDGEWIVARCINLLEQVVNGSWTFGWSLVEARVARLDETPGNDVPIEGGRVQFSAAPHEVVTLLVR